jgi:hypothetical protein
MPGVRPLPPTLLLLAALPLSACDPPAPDPKTLAQIRDMHTEAEATARPYTSMWRAAIEGAGDLASRPDPGPCPVNVGVPVLALAGNLDGLEFGLHLEQTSPVRILRREKLAEADSPRARMILSQLAALSDPTQPQYKELSDADRLAKARQLSEERWTWDLVVVIDLQQAASDFNLDAGTFNGGGAVGSAYVYDYAARAIVCTGRFVAESSRTLQVKKGEASGVAEVDLLARIAEGAFENLHKVGSAPPPPAATSTAKDGGATPRDAGRGAAR